jgi:molecular chaperone GrpE (heat shock protein)
VPEALDVTCPCCQSTLKIDPETGAVVWVDEKRAPAQNLDDLVSRVRSQRSTLDEKFERSVQQTRNQRAILDKKFEEARKHAAANPNERPVNPFDLD